MLNLVDFNSARDEQGTKVYFIWNQQLVDNSSALSDNMIIETDDFHLHWEDWSSEKKKKIRTQPQNTFSTFYEPINVTQHRKTSARSTTATRCLPTTDVSTS